MIGTECVRQDGDSGGDQKQQHEHTTQTHTHADAPQHAASTDATTQASAHMSTPPARSEGASACDDDENAPLCQERPVVTAAGRDSESPEYPYAVAVPAARPPQKNSSRDGRVLRFRYGQLHSFRHGPKAWLTTPLLSESW